MMIEGYPSTPVRGFRVIDAGGGTVSLTGIITETVLKTVIIPANALGPNGVLKIGPSVFSMVSSANIKSLGGRIGAVGSGITGARFFDSGNLTTTQSYNDIERIIANAGVTNSQLGRNAGSSGAGATGSALFTASVDTTEAFEINWTVAIAAAETVSLRAWSIEVCPG